MTNLVRTTKFKSMLLAGAAMGFVVSAPAGAQGPAPSGAADPVEKVTVTGSRIKQKNLQTQSPVTQVSGADVDRQGVTRVEDLTNQLPQVFSAQGSNISNGASGTATVNLRGLGSVRNLVLINGRRTGYGSPLDPSPDLNQIPAQLIDRVEVYTGGASGVYGSDAISGVINFIMRKDYEGVQLDTQYGFYQHNNDHDGPGNLRNVIAGRSATNPSQFRLPRGDVNDGFSKDVTGVMGVNSADEKGNITAYMGYRTNDAVLQGERDYSACALGTSLNGSDFTCGGSSTSFPGRFTDFGVNFTNPILFTNTLAENQNAQNRTSFNYTVGGPAGFTGFSSALNQYNFGPLNYYQRPDERYMLGAYARYQVDEHVELYSEMMFTDYKTLAQIAPSGNFFNTATINCDNPLLSASQQLLVCGDGTVGYVLDAGGLPTPDFGADGVAGGLNSPGLDGIFGDDPTTEADESEDDVFNTDGLPCVDPDPVTPGNQCSANFYVGRRNVEGGGRVDDLQYQSYRMVTGARGEIIPGWDYDLALQYSRVKLSRVYRNDFSVTRIARALDVVDADPGVDVDPQCRSVVDGTDPNCVPYNIFTPGGVSQDALNYLQIPLVQVGATSQREATFVLNMDLGTFDIQSPWAETPFAAVVGVDWRRDELESDTDAAFASGDGAGQGGPTIGFPLAAVDLTEYFGELEMYLLEDQPWAKQVKVHGSYRYSEYDTGLTADTYGVGADWAPVADVRFRGSYQHAFRGPNVIELFSPQGVSLFDMNDDPCDATDPAGDGYAGDAACIGAAAWQVTPAQAAAGALSSPAGQYNQLTGGNPALNGETADTITLGVVFTPTFLKGLMFSIDWFQIETNDFVTTQGASTTVSDCFDNGNASACALITRNPNSGSLWIGSGVVSNLNTNLNPGLKVSGVDLVGAYKIDMGAGDLQLDLIGTYLDEWDGGGAAAGTNCVGFYNCGNDVTPEWRHRFRTTWVSPWDADLSVTWRYRGDVENPDGNPGEPDFTLEEKHYFDVATTFAGPVNTRFRLGVNNVLDEDPPLSRFTGAGFGNGNTFPQYYDSLGRWAFIGISVDM